MPIALVIAHTGVVAGHGAAATAFQPAIAASRVSDVAIRWCVYRTDRLPPKPLHCDCIWRKSQLTARGRNSMSSTSALEVAIRRLQKGRMRSMRAAAAVLADLRDELAVAEESSAADARVDAPHQEGVIGEGTSCATQPRT